MIHILEKGTKKVKVMTAKDITPDCPIAYKTYIFDSNSKGIIDIKSSKTVYNKNPKKAIEQHKLFVRSYLKDGWQISKE